MEGKIECEPHSSRAARTGNPFGQKIEFPLLFRVERD